MYVGGGALSILRTTILKFSTSARNSRTSAEDAEGCELEAVEAGEFVESTEEVIKVGVDADIVPDVFSRNN